MAEPHHHQSRRKTMRLNEISDKDEEDYISLLPDCLLVEIISRLPDTKQAIRTGTLSKQWQPLWPYVHNLLFGYDNYYHLDKTQFCQSNLHKLKIHTFYHSELQLQVNNWIRYAVSRNVQDLDLFLCFPFVLGEFMFINSCFTRLKLEICVFNPTGAISWSKLTSLYIGGSDLSEDLIQNILSGCPLLETFELCYCLGFRHLDITSKSVKNFMFTGYMDFDKSDYYDNVCRFGGDSEEEDYYKDTDDIIEINAPYIVSLKIAHELWWSKLLLVDVSCLVKAHLDYKMRRNLGAREEHEEMLKGLILSLRHVKELKLGKSCLKVLSRLEDKGFTFPSNIEHPDDWPDYDSFESVDCFDNNSTGSGDQLELQVGETLRWFKS